MIYNIIEIIIWNNIFICIILHIYIYQIQKGLLQVGKGLQFLNDANVVHHNLTPEAIFVNAKVKKK